MDVSALSVSIEVDMSAFIEAMDKISATLIATADLFDTVSKNIAKAFSNIGKSSDDAGGAFDTFIDKGSKVAEVTDVISKVFELGPEGEGVALIIGGIAIAMDKSHKSTVNANKRFDTSSIPTQNVQKLISSSNNVNLRGSFSRALIETSDATKTIKPNQPGYDRAIPGKNIPAGCERQKAVWQPHW